MKAFLDRGARPCGLELSLASDIPVGAGLSSSAALECSIASLMEELWEHRLDPVEKVILCQQVEHAFVGMLAASWISPSSPLQKRTTFSCWIAWTDRISTSPCLPTFRRFDSGHQGQACPGGRCYARRRQECHACLEALGRSSWRGAEDMASTKLESLPYPARARHVISEMATLKRWIAFKGAWRPWVIFFTKAMPPCGMTLRSHVQNWTGWSKPFNLSVHPPGSGWAHDRRWFWWLCGGSGGTFTSRENSGRLQSGFHAQFGHPPDGFVSTPASGCQIERPGPLHRLDHPDRFGRTPRRLSP